MKQMLTLLMALIFLVACGGTAVTPTPAPAPAQAEPAASVAADSPTTQTFTVVTAESQASYIVNEEFLVDALSKLGINAGQVVVVGTTPGVSGEIKLDMEQADWVQSAEFTVDMSGLRTDQNRRDEWLRDNALQTSRFPQATFVKTAVSGLPASYTEGEEVTFEMTGNLTVRTATIPVTFLITAVMSGDTIQGTATTNLNMSDLGIEPPNFVRTLTVADPFAIEISLTARN
jgi:polyisoprenoid-binding protein YceI